MKTAKLIAMLLVVAMCLSLAACGSSASSGEEKNDAPAATEGEHEEIIINYPSIWVGTDSKAAYLAEMIAAFNEENAGSIKVVVEEQPDYQAARDKLRTLITTGNVPDVCNIDIYADVAEYAQSGLFMDMTPYLEEGWKDDWVDGALDAVTYDGKVSILPIETAVFPVCYNTEILAECGYETFPDNFDDMLAMFRDIKSKGYNAMGQMAGENAWTSMLWYSLIVEAIGGKDVYADGLSNPAFVQAAEILKEMYNYSFDGAISAGAADVNGHFINRDTAVYVNGPWWIANFYKEENGGLNEVIGVTTLPKFEGGKGEGSVVTAVQGCLGFAKQDDPAKEAAVVKFAQYITDPERIAKWSASSGAMFFIKHEASADVTPIAQEFNDILNNATFTLNYFNNQFPSAAASEFPAAVSALVLGQVDAQGFVDQLQAAIDAA